LPVQGKNGLGIKDLRKMNINLLCKWWWILETKDGLWQDIVKLKYVKNSPTCLIPNRYNDSPIWCDLMKIRHIYLKGRTIKIQDGKRVSFWLDDRPLCPSYPVLYELCLIQNSSMYGV
jgi:hypothetical protein